jgi:hypothetical protein
MGVVHVYLSLSHGAGPYPTIGPADVSEEMARFPMLYGLQKNGSVEQRFRDLGRFVRGRLCQVRVTAVGAALALCLLLAGCGPDVAGRAGLLRADGGHLIAALQTCGAVVTVVAVENPDTGGRYGRWVPRRKFSGFLELDLTSPSADWEATMPVPGAGRDDRPGP